LPVALVRRSGKYLVPDGATVLQADDHVLILGDKDVLPEVESRLGSQQNNGTGNHS